MGRPARSGTEVVPFGGEGAEQAVEDDQHAAVVLVEILGVEA